MSNLSSLLTTALRCPITGSPLTQIGDTLISTSKGPNGESYSYAIDEGIPLMLATEATIIPA